MSFTNEQKEEMFKEELSRIFDNNIKEFTRLCIIYAPNYIFEDCPSSTGGKYHPIDELGPDGLIIHTKKVFTLAYEIVKALECEHNRDLILAASIIHDLRKKGIDENAEYAVSDHPNHAANLVDEIQDATQLLSDEQHSILRRCVGFHYGPWSEGNWKKHITEFTMEELALFMSDYVASKRFIKVDYRRN